ncbi:beta-glucosidase [Zalerion maritima]|uniref:Beta-glucosidase cel3A n=1 Tax=Zalerion maritima TaxID=339359 RepID=A0AAD5RHT3_9PEZI|nr:beta-glucosidase [Zalerion maritima]
MASVLSVVLSALLVARPGAASDGNAFGWVQSVNTTTLGQYGDSPAVYPSPNISSTGAWEAALEKASAFLAQLTLEEKASMVSGEPGPCVGNIYPIERLGFSGLCLQDGPLAIRVADYASVFEAGVTIASTWDRTMMYERTLAMGAEFKAKGAHIALAPVCGPLGRSAYAGRNWEGFSPDPYLTGVGMEESIAGFQDAGVQATAKHFIGNEQEVMRNPVFLDNGTVTDIQFDSISSNIDDRTMHEIYLWPFANAVHANVAAVMCSYQRINGSYACQNSKAQNGLLKGELGFQGYIMSDWGATHAGVPAIEAGLDMDMPGGLGLYGMVRNGNAFFGGNITTAVNNGTLDEARLDDMILRIMAPYYHLGQDQDFPSVDPSSAQLNTFSPVSTWLQDWNLTGESSRDVRGDHRDLIREHAAAATVLLKNENSTLPLKSPKVIAVFGNDASTDTQGFLNQNDFEYGTLSAGGGSGTGQLTYLITPLEAIQARAAEDNALVQYWLNNTLIANSEMPDLWIPNTPDVCLVFLKTWAEEAADRSSLHVDWNGDDVVASVAKYCANTVVVTHSSGINVLPWADHPNVTAILAAHYPGEQTGNALVDVLYGAVNPSGHLPYTVALNASDYNAPPTTDIQTSGKEDWQSWFDEKLEIDYRHFDANDMAVRYEFGFGLSYTTFDMADMRVEMITVLDQANVPARPERLPVQPGGNPAVWAVLCNVTAGVRNTGDVAGAAVAQLYLGFPESAPPGTPPRQLRGFDKVLLEPGETGTASFSLMRRDLSYWDVVSQEWVIPTGEFTVNVGFSSRDIVLVGNITVIEG